ncbi:MAG: helix-turn-helix domain-containing protein, partial [Thermoplasmata archaeon]
MSRLFVRSLTEGEVLEIRRQRDGTNDAKFFRRCQAILLSNKGCRTSQIADVLDVSSRTARNWIHLCEVSSLYALSPPPFIILLPFPVLPQVPDKLSGLVFLANL